jgi:5-formaminoimidazole-4-carboxamide-1-(beta)-D-ribofuranosyl 5'-monophosphate synthetase
MANQKIDISQPITIAVIGSHSALDVCRGAKQHGFKTLVIAQKGREKTYANYYKTRSNNGIETGCVDDCIVVEKFADILQPKIQQQLISKNTIFVPHRSFEVYLDFNYQAIENDFQVAMFGNRHLLKIEERGVKPNQYDLLAAAKIHYPQQFTDPKDIDRLCLVKVLEEARGFERAFFLVKDYQDYQRQVEQMLKDGVITEQLLNQAVIEEFVLGVHVNFNFFYSPLTKQIQLLGTDARRQTNFEGFIKTPAQYQAQLAKKITIKYEEAGHMAVTVLESLLEPAFAMAESFVTASQKLVDPGVIGPFALQSIITPGPPKKEIVVIDVSPRMPGSPGIAATPYTGYLYGEKMSVGDRVGLEIKQAVTSKSLAKIIS